MGNLNPVIARIPATVWEIRAKLGQEVKKGDVVIVLESMKMEHPMESPVDGIVRGINVQQGDKVERGKLLVVVEER